VLPQLRNGRTADGSRHPLELANAAPIGCFLNFGVRVRGDYWQLAISRHEEPTHLVPLADPLADAAGRA
jgi:hypothetical protein